MTASSRPPARLLLWDIDGTLIRAGDIARLAFERAVEAVVGRPAADHGIRMGGKTDPQIAREILATMTIVEDEADGHVPGIMSELEAQLAGAAEQLRHGGQVLPGVSTLLARLAGEPGVVQSTLTGNLAANAAAKLGAFGLDQHIDLEVGAYGSDHHDRVELVPVAVERVRRLRGLEPEVVWVIGDTSYDLACARAGGAKCLLVGTGRIPLVELKDMGADAVFADLGDVNAVAAVLLGP